MKPMPVGMGPPQPVGVYCVSVLSRTRFGYLSATTTPCGGVGGLWGVRVGGCGVWVGGLGGKGGWGGGGHSPSTTC